MFDLQSHFIFPTNAVAIAGPLPDGAQLLEMKTSEGAKLVGVHIAPEQAVRERQLVLGFGGNAWNGQDVAQYLHEVFPEADVVAFHYRGYRPSTGSPSAQALIEDAPAIFDLATKLVKPKVTIAVGLSIGSGIAAQLAAVRKLDGVILVTPFDSLKAVAEAMFPWLPIGLFFDHEVDAADPLARTKVPTAIIEAERDEIVPRQRTNALRAKVANLVFDQTIPRAGHNDIYARSDFHEAMRDAFQALVA